MQCLQIKNHQKKHKNWCKILTNSYLDLKFSTSNVFGTRKLILYSDFENSQIGVIYNAMPPGEKSSKELQMCYHYREGTWIGY